MKKLFLFCLAAAMLLLFGCSNKEKLQKPISFYYLSEEIIYGAENAVLSSEDRECVGLSTEETIALYFAGPKLQNLISPFPADTSLVTFQLRDKELYITLSDQYAQLNGLALTKANACVAQTLLRLTDANRIIISCESKPLGGDARVELTQADLVLFDDGSGKPDSTAPTKSTQE